MQTAVQQRMVDDLEQAVPGFGPVTAGKLRAAQALRVSIL